MNNKPKYTLTQKKSNCNRF